MKKLLVILLSILMVMGLAACTNNTPTDEPTDEPTVEPTDGNDVVAGGWQIVDSLPEMDDAIFNEARQGYVGMELSPLQILGTQPVSGENIAYLCYGTTVAANPVTALKIAIVYDDGNKNYEITNVADFNIEDYLDGEGQTTPDGLMGGWKDNTELPNMLDDKANAVFEKATEGLVGVGYTPVALLGTQVVAGTNYAFLALGTTVTADPMTHLYVISVYEDLSGNTTINNICGINLGNYTANYTK